MARKSPIDYKSECSQYIESLKQGCKTTVREHVEKRSSELGIPINFGYFKKVLYALKPQDMKRPCWSKKKAGPPRGVAMLEIRIELTGPPIEALVKSVIFSAPKKAENATTHKE